MKKKIITIVVTITFVAGAGTAAGVIIDKNIKAEDASVAEQTVSSTLPQTSEKDESTETITEKKPSNKQAAANSTTTTTEKQTENTTTTTEVATVTIKRAETTKSTTQIYYYYDFYKVAVINEELYNIYKLSGNGPDKGKYTYKDINDKEYILNDVNNLNFVSDHQVYEKRFDKNNEPYWETINFRHNGKPICYDKEGNKFYLDDEDNRIFI